MNKIIRWLFRRSLGEIEARQLHEELEELHRLRIENDGEDGADRWLETERRRALLCALGGVFRRKCRPNRPREESLPSSPSVVEKMREPIRDLRFALRTLRRRPLFTLLVVGTLGLGIGASTTVFSLVNGILLRDMDYERPGELLTIWKAFPEWRDNEVLSGVWNKIGFRWREFLALRERARLFSDVAIHCSRNLILTNAGSPVRLVAGEASANLFPLLGVRPQVGRVFLPGEEGPGAPRLAVLSHELWETRFGSDLDVVGRPITLDGEAFEVIGVLPPGFRLHSNILSRPSSSVDGGDQALWIPIYLDRDASFGGEVLEAMGRLAPDATREQALAEVDAILRRGRSTSEVAFRLTPPKDEVVGRHRSPLLLLLAAAGVLLIIACGNVATLLLGEAIDRRGEISTRVALGASRSRIIRQLVKESMTLGVCGSLVGVALAVLGVRGFLALGPPLPRLEQVGVDRGILLFAVLAGLASALLFGFAPALLQHRDSLRSGLDRGGRSVLGGGGAFQKSMISTQLALTMILLVTGGLLARSLMYLTRLDPGFSPESVATVRVLIPRAHFRTANQTRAERMRRFYSEVLQEVEAIPGALRAGAIDDLPFPGRRTGTGFIIEGRAPEDDGRLPARDHFVSPGYFESMGIRLQAGRGFSDDDMRVTRAPVAVINETMARQYWPNGSPIGAGIIEVGTRYRYEIIGVVGDVREIHPGETPLPMVYRPYLRSPGDFSIVARAAGSPEDLVPLMREAIRSVDPGIPLGQQATMGTLVARSTRAERFRAFLVAAFSVLATLLASVGVFGVTARSVAHRHREMGIRMALGARGRELVRLVALATLRAGALGIGAGVLGALVTTRLLTAFLFGTEAWDVWTFSTASLLLGSLCVAAALVAARRVTRMEPMRVLREE